MSRQPLVYCVSTRQKNQHAGSFFYVLQVANPLQPVRLSLEPPWEAVGYEVFLSQPAAFTCNRVLNCSIATFYFIKTC